MTFARYLVGDTRRLTRTLADESVDLVLTSPPFLGLRDYLPDDHPHKTDEIGVEPSPVEFLDALLDVADEWRRVLAPHGSIAVELGDSYAGSGGAGGDYSAGGMRDGQPVFDGSAKRRRVAMRNGKASGSYGNRPGADRTSTGDGWPLDKSLTGIPTLFAWSLAYGRNLLNPEHTIEPWRIRNVITWIRPNPPVGELGDKVRPASSSITCACINKSRYFDLDAARTETGGPLLDWFSELDDDLTNGVLYLTTQGYKGAHYATYPSLLPTVLIDLMCPREVCRKCGDPRRRLTEQDDAGKSITVGWSDCGHDDYRPGVVLDPFAGTGTTLAAATGMARDAIGFDLDARNVDHARDRVGFFLTDIEYEVTP